MVIVSHSFTEVVKSIEGKISAAGEPPALQAGKLLWKEKSWHDR
jgi:hypothetical protein